MIKRYLETAVNNVKELDGKLGKNAEYALADALNEVLPSNTEAVVTIGTKSTDIVIKRDGVILGYVEVKARTSFHRKIEWGAVTNKRGFIGRSLYDPKQKKYRELFFVYFHVVNNVIERAFIRAFNEVRFYRSGGHGQVKNVSIEYFNGNDYNANGFSFPFSIAIKNLRMAANLKV